MRRSICLILLTAVFCAGCFGCVSSGFENESEQWMQQVLDAVAAEDDKTLTSLFDTGLADAPDTQDLFDFIEGDIVSCEFTAGPSYMSTHGGLYRQHDIGCDFTTTIGAYRMAIRITGGKTNMAVQSLYIIRAEDIDPDIGYWGSIHFRPGIIIVENP